MRDPVLLGTEPLTHAANALREAAATMTAAANQIEFVFAQRRAWEEEYLARLEALVERELTFYGGDGK